MALSTTWLRDVVDLLAAASLGTEGVDLFEGPPPDIDSVPGPAMGIVAYAGRGGAHTYDSGGFALAYDYPRFQVQCRDAVDESVAPLTRANAVYNYLATHVGFVVGASVFPFMNCLQTPFPVGGRDPKGYYTFGFNVEAMRNG